MTLAYKTIDSPVGKLKLVASDKGLVAVLWEREKPNRVRLGEVEKRETHPVLIKAERQIAEYFARKRRSFSIPIDMQGTLFQKQVWDALLAIPFGENKNLWRSRQATRETASCKGCGRCQRQKSLIDHRALSSRRRLDW